MTNNSGLFVTVEGIDGCGKTTATTMLFDALQELGLGQRVQQVSTFHTSSWTAYARTLLTSKERNISNDTLLMMMLDVHTYNYHYHIKPLVEKGFIVIVDRSVVSTMVFQLSQGLKDIDASIAYQHLLGMRADILPELIVHIDVDPSTARYRLAVRGDSEGDRIESQSLDKHMEYRKEYQKIVEFRGRGSAMTVPNTGSVADLKRMMQTVATVIASSTC